MYNEYKSLLNLELFNPHETHSLGLHYLQERFTILFNIFYLRF